MLKNDLQRIVPLSVAAKRLCPVADKLELRRIAKQMREGNADFDGLVLVRRTGKTKANNSVFVTEKSLLDLERERHADAKQAAKLRK